ncbi:MAG: hypothetical protein CMO31_02750 [Trueperaceae bacterium]|jgi:hypothetical protein|nr:hypothetical protein [Trueperaceae bacterium]
MCATFTWATNSGFEEATFVISLLGLIVLLIFLAGVTAYAGDRLGMFVARRRLSLFGIRPRRTGQIVGVVAGILITLTTLIVLSLAFRGATQTIINAQQVGEELNRLRAERLTLEGEIRTLGGIINELDGEVGNLSVQAESLRAENRDLQFRNQQLGDANATLGSRNINLQVVNDQLRSEILDSNDQVRGLKSQVDKLQVVLEGQAAELDRIRVQFDQVTNTQIVFADNELVYSGLLRATSPIEARDELSKLVLDASEKTLAEGAGAVQLLTEQFDRLVEAVTQTPVVDLVLFISPKNQFLSEDIFVSVEVLPNTKLLPRGHLVLSRQIHLGSGELKTSQAEVGKVLAGLLLEAQKILESTGLVSPDPIHLRQEEEEFLTQLLRLTGPVSIGVVTTEDIYRGAPARLELLILH